MVTAHIEEPRPCAIADKCMYSRAKLVDDVELLGAYPPAPPDVAERAGKELGADLAATLGDVAYRSVRPDWPEPRVAVRMDLHHRLDRGVAELVRRDVRPLAEKLVGSGPEARLIVSHNVRRVAELGRRDGRSSSRSDRLECRLEDLATGQAVDVLAGEELVRIIDVAAPGRLGDLFH